MRVYMLRAGTEFAMRTSENSRAIYRWDQVGNSRLSPQSGRLKSLPGHQEGQCSVALFTSFRALIIFTSPLCGLCMLTLAALLLTAITIATAAQTPNRKPSVATRPVVVMSAQSLDDLTQKLQPGNKTEELIDSAGMQLRVAVQHETNRTDAAAELHDLSDDVYYVLEGEATLLLGGQLDAPKEVEPGEWRSPRIIAGKTYRDQKGRSDRRAAWHSAPAQHTRQRVHYDLNQDLRRTSEARNLQNQLR